MSRHHAAHGGASVVDTDCCVDTTAKLNGITADTTAAAPNGVTPTAADDTTAGTATVDPVDPATATSGPGDASTPRQRPPSPHHRRRSSRSSLPTQK